MPSPDLSTWLTKADAAARLGISQRTLDRLDAKGEGPECRNRPRPGKRPEPVYSPSDVETLAAAKPAMIAATSPIGPQRSGLMDPTPAGIGVQRATHGGLIDPSRPADSAGTQDLQRPFGMVLARVIEHLAGAAAAVAQSQREPTPWLTMPEAAAYTGLSETLLRRLARSGQLESMLDGARKVRRRDLDTLDFTAVVAARAWK